MYDEKSTCMPSEKNVKLESLNLDSFKLESVKKAKTHLFMHTREKPFSCELCTYVSGELRLIKRHAMLHKSEKPQKCKNCDLCPSLSTKVSQFQAYRRETI